MASPTKPDAEQKVLVFPKEHAQVTATTTVKLFKSRKRIRIDRVDYINPTGLVGASGNAFKGEIKSGATVCASLFNTDTGAAGATLAPDTFVTGTNGTKANRTIAKDTDITLVLTETGAATLPAGTVLVYYTELN